MTASTTDKTYNGWTNFETWAVGMWLDGNYDGEGTYLLALEYAIEARANNFDDETGYADDSAAWELSQSLEAFFDEQMPADMASGICQDLLGSAVSSINWLELAEAKITEVRENANHARTD